MFEGWTVCTFFELPSCFLRRQKKLLLTFGPLRPLTIMKTTVLGVVGGIAIGVSSCWLYTAYTSSPSSSSTISLPASVASKHGTNKTDSNSKHKTAFLSSSSPLPPNTNVPMKDATRTSPVALHYVSVGFIDSCFASCRGTPRQGFLMPSAKALLVLHSDISEHTLEGLANYSHVWVLFHFHKNKIPKDRTKTAKQRAGIQKRKRPRFKAKINPPKLTDGTKVGVFSARTPHRPNAIGLTLVRLEKVDIQKKTLTLSGVDLVHGTPVVDIKPYVPHYDAIPTATVPQWVATSLSTSMLNVEITDQVQTSMANYLKDRKNGGSTSASAATKKKRKKRGTATRTHLYNDVDTMVHAVVEMLQLDMNSGATANKVLQAAKEKETETEKEKEVGVETGKGNSGMERKARVFYASLDGFKYTCKWYEEQQNIVVVGCEIDHV